MLILNLYILLLNIILTLTQEIRFFWHHPRALIVSNNVNKLRGFHVCHTRTHLWPSLLTKIHFPNVTSPQPPKTQVKKWHPILFQRELTGQTTTDHNRIIPRIHEILKWCTSNNARVISTEPNNYPNNLFGRARCCNNAQRCLHFIVI